MLVLKQGGRVTPVNPVKKVYLNGANLMAKVNVFITVDTEHSIGGAFRDPKLKPVGNEKRVFGKIGDTAYGIPLIMDIADLNKLPITFFVEVLNKYYFGEDETKKVCKYIIDRGHDIQLHLHPNYLNFTRSDPGKLYFRDNIYCYNLSRQIELIDEGKKLLTKYGTGDPIAFRAGNFAADTNTLIALKKNGFLINSSYNNRYIDKECRLDDLKINDASRAEEIWEFPITNFREFSCLGLHRTKPLDINGASFLEMKAALNYAKEHGPKNVTIILHSFSFIKAYDAQYNKMKPRFHVIRRFEKLCRFLSENSQTFRVATFGSLDRQELEKMCSNPIHTFPKVPTYLSFLRYFEQLHDRIF